MGGPTVYLDVRVFNPFFCPKGVPASPKVIGSMSMRKSELTSTDSLRWSIQHLHHWYSLLRGAWQELDDIAKKLASLLADNWDQTYSSTIFWVCSRLSFSLLHSAIQCIHSARSSHGCAVKFPPSIDLVNAEAQLRLS